MCWVLMHSTRVCLCAPHDHTYVYLCTTCYVPMGTTCRAPVRTTHCVLCTYASRGSPCSSGFIEMSHLLPLQDTQESCGCFPWSPPEPPRAHRATEYLDSNVPMQPGKMSHKSCSQILASEDLKRRGSWQDQILRQKLICAVKAPGLLAPRLLSRPLL